AQGEAISVLLRADHLAPGNGYGIAAARAALPFRRDVAHGGVVWRAGRDVFFEEIANEHAPHVLNGCIFALWGLWELWNRDREPWQRDLIEQCVETLVAWLPAFDTGWWTLYSLLRTPSGRPHLATLKYHQFHIAQTRVLARMFDRPAFSAAADRWASYVERSGSRARLTAATLGSLPDRVLRRDTVAGGART
ncbi:MAG TPA: D-glucuronyl C5-epimerase family protein, partial [Candidatus Baltobacteraceae bacterium]|nr:D-glucuronyl C5-epimerase family protein [Candidatus Baltobacteraceae bacterium]